MKTIVEILDQNKALNTNAASGNAVAVPRFSGKLEAARGSIVRIVTFNISLEWVEYWYTPVLIAPEKAEQPPVPVMKAKKQRKMIGTEPSPCS